ncbi:MAG: phosphoribosylformylglycinamidine cyclo-ligase [Candidatus Omnitrophica bacterium]|nr:phosphoribosylformylglycinamidine cyclo-ligase [Candidatus Omnitrophota bacterium]
MKKLSYRRAGVDVAGAGRFISAIEPLARLTRRPGLLRGIGGFGGLFEIGALSHPDSVLVASSDGVGTKLKLAQRAGWYFPLGIDLVAMNVNDILCTGAEPLFFLDYIAAGRLEQSVLLEIMRGIVRGCVDSHCVLLGGETAQMPLVYGRNDFDLAGFAVGIVRKRSVVTGLGIRPGDVLLGLASNGIHANGFTLVQKALSPVQLKKLGRELMKPTRIYVRPVLELLRGGAPVRGIAHITGGSFREKLRRVLPEGITAVVRKQEWPVPAVFRSIQKAGVGEEEMYRTFNMGVGMVLILPRSVVGRTQQLLKRRGVQSWMIGEVRKGPREVIVE